MVKLLGKTQKSVSKKGSSSSGKPKKSAAKAAPKPKMTKQSAPKKVKAAAVAVAPAGEKKQRKKRAKKDPHAPKRGKSAYIFFSIEKSKELRDKKENVGKGAPEISKLVGQEWRALADKAPYQKKADKDKERYQSEKKAYDAMLAGMKTAKAPPEAEERESGGGDAEESAD